MTTAIELIVGTYVRLKNRPKLEQMMIHRQQLALDLTTRSWVDVSIPIQQVNHDIAVIEAGLAKLSTVAAA